MTLYGLITAYWSGAVTSRSTNNAPSVEVERRGNIVDPRD